jgi:hypothetical protein
VKTWCSETLIGDIAFDPPSPSASRYDMNAPDRRRGRHALGGTGNDDAVAAPTSPPAHPLNLPWIAAPASMLALVEALSVEPGAQP